jgi:hypothetical protein
LGGETDLEAELSTDLASVVVVSVFATSVLATSFFVVSLFFDTGSLFFEGFASLILWSFHNKNL